jgi:asparagine synthase (glutamine-hydrolysing)
MAGICGIVARSGQDQSGLVITEMAECLRHESWHVAQHLVTAGGAAALACVTRSGAEQALRVGRLSDHPAVAILDGEIYNLEECLSCLAAHGQPCSESDPAQVLLRGYLTLGQKFFREIDGRFACAIFDPEQDRLILVNDRLGLRPLYYTHLPGRFLFASALRALFVDPETSRAPGVRGLAQFFTFGHLWLNDTQFDGVKVLPAAAWVEYDLVADTPRVDRYWRMPTPNGSGKESPERYERIADTFQRAVDMQTRGPGQLGLSLSGGLDSRTILAAMHPQQTRPITVSMGVAGSLDHRCARRMAELTGCPYHAYVLDDRFLDRFEEHLRRMVRLTDGQYLSQCIVMPTLPYYRELGIDVLLRGHGGELMHLRKAYNYSLDDAALRIATPQELRAWLMRRLRAYMLDGVEKPVFAFATMDEINDLAEQTLDTALAETDAWSPPLQRISHLFVDQRLRRETAMSLVKFGSQVEVRMPLVDARLIESLLELPIESRLDDNVQRRLIQRTFPALLGVTNANNGSRLGAGKLAQRFNYARLRVLSKLRVPGYEPYERLGLWLRRELAPLVRRVLLAPSCLDRGLFAADGVRQVVEAHLAGRRNHTYLLMAMLIVEVGQQELIDKRSTADAAA